MLVLLTILFFFFFFNGTSPPEIYTLSLHDALPICLRSEFAHDDRRVVPAEAERVRDRHGQVDRKSTRLNSSHTVISYAVFCLKKKKQTNTLPTTQLKSDGANSRHKIDDVDSGLMMR